MDGVVSTKSHCGAQCGGSAITILAVPNSAPNETRVLTASGQLSLATESAWLVPIATLQAVFLGTIFFSRKQFKFKLQILCSVDVDCPGCLSNSLNFILLKLYNKMNFIHLSCVGKRIELNPTIIRMARKAGTFSFFDLN